MHFFKIYLREDVQFIKAAEDLPAKETLRVTRLFTQPLCKMAAFTFMLCSSIERLTQSDMLPGNV